MRTHQLSWGTTQSCRVMRAELGSNISRLGFYSRGEDTTLAEAA